MDTQANFQVSTSSLDEFRSVALDRNLCFSFQFSINTKRTGCMICLWQNRCLCTLICDISIFNCAGQFVYVSIQRASLAYIFSFFFMHNYDTVTAFHLCLGGYTICSRMNYTTFPSSPRERVEHFHS